jgi:hypothetical protein
MNKQYIDTECVSPNLIAYRLVTDRLPELLDVKALRLELGITRAAADALMRHVPIVSTEDGVAVRSRHRWSMTAVLLPGV